MASGGVLPLISRQYFPRNDQKCPYTQTQNTYIHSKTGKEYFNIIRKLLIQHKNLQNKILNIIFFFYFFLTYSDFRIPIPTCFWPSMYKKTPPRFYFESCHKLLSDSFRIAALKIDQNYQDNVSKGDFHWYFENTGLEFY